MDRHSQCILCKCNEKVFILYALHTFVGKTYFDLFLSKQHTTQHPQIKSL